MLIRRTKAHRTARTAALLLMVCSLALLPFTAFATTTDVGGIKYEEQDNTPASNISNKYSVTFSVPKNWTSESSATVKITVKDVNGTGWTKVEVKQGDGEWSNITSNLSENGGIYSLAATSNCTVYVRITATNGIQVMERTDLKCFDRNPPAIQPDIQRETLHVTATDDISGVAGLQINGLLFTTVKNGAVDVSLSDDLGSYERITVRGFDYAGNFSEPVSLSNPCYQKPTEEPTQVPVTNTPTPSPTPSATPSGFYGGGNNNGGNGNSNTNGTDYYYYGNPTNNPYYQYPYYQNPYQQQSTQQVQTTPQIVYVTAAPTAAPVVQTEYVPVGPGMPFKSDGNSKTLDVLYSPSTNKQFITVQTKDGNVFYLVIDYDKPIDEDAELYETYFLNPVDDRDLIALLGNEAKEEVPTPTPRIIYVTPEPNGDIPAPAITEAPVEPAPKSNSDSIMYLAVFAVAAVVFVIFYMKKRKGKQAQPANNFATGNDYGDYDDEDDEDDDGEG